MYLLRLKLIRFIGRTTLLNLTVWSERTAEVEYRMSRRWRQVTSASYAVKSMIMAGKRHNGKVEENAHLYLTALQRGWRTKIKALLFPIFDTT